MRPGLFLWLLLLFLSAPAVCSASSPGGMVAVDFIYVNANAGEAAGGHTALRLADSVFHYQFFPDSSFLLVREPWESFRFLYTELHNRSISIASLLLSTPVETQIRNHFTELLLVQQEFMDDMAALQMEKLFVEQALAEDLKVSVQCLGFFNRISKPFDAEKPLHLLAEAYFLQESKRKADVGLQKSVQELMDGKRLGKSFQEGVAWSEALGVLLGRFALRSDACIPPLQGEEPLGVQEKRMLQEYSNVLLKNIEKLLSTDRPDRGEALLLQLARYLTVQQSLRDGHLLTLDPFLKTYGLWS